MTGQATTDVGRLGESLAARFLEERGYTIINRNFRCKVGEIDIIAQKGKTIHLVEVKSVSRENMGYRQEELVHRQKVAKIRKTGELYLFSRETPTHSDSQIDVIAVTMDQVRKIARCRLIEHAEEMLENKVF